MADQYFAMQDMERERARPKATERRVAPQGPKPKENRDPKDINPHLQCQFYHVLAEPKSGPQSVDCVWEFAEVVYDCCKDCWYKLFGLFCGCCIAMAWGLEFVPIIASHVWCLTPFNQMFKIIINGCCKPAWYLCIGLCLVPYTQSCAYFFHNCAYGKVTRPPTPPLFPDRPKKKTPQKPIPKKKEPVVEKKKAAKTAAPVVATAAAAGGRELGDFDKQKVAESVRRQLMLV